MSDSDSSLDSELLAVAGARKGGGKKRGRKALSSDEEEDVSSEEVSLDDESDMEEMRAARWGAAARAGACGAVLRRGGVHSGVAPWGGRAGMWDGMAAWFGPRA